MENAMIESLVMGWFDVLFTQVKVIMGVIGALGVFCLFTIR